MDTFLAAGFTLAHVLEVIVITAIKTISNDTTHLARTPLDNVFASRTWTSPEESHDDTTQ
ncbi:MAG: hypothetical protein AMXMBFR20_34740 [Planctomycetia bacterium]